MSVNLRDERGTTALIVAAGMVLLMGAAALAVDLGLGFNERRQDQASADSGVMAGALQGFEGAAGVRDATLDYVRKNLPTSYGAASNPVDPTWLALWDGCVDPGRPAGYQAVPSMAGMASATIDCISVDPVGKIRVRVPDQLIDAAFGKVLGVGELSTWAFAEASLFPLGAEAGVLPLAISSAAGQGAEVCVVAGSGVGLQATCDASGRVVNSPQLGNADHGTVPACSGILDQRLAANLRLGIDHFVTAHPDGTDSDGSADLPPNSADDWVPDNCNYFAPNRLTVSAGGGAGLTDGLADNSVVGPAPGSVARLRTGSGLKRLVKNGTEDWYLDNVALWEYLVPNTVPGCHPDDFAPLLPPDKTLQLDVCLAAAAGSGQRLFSRSLLDSPRFGLGVRVWETSWTTSGSVDRTLREFVPIFIHSIHFNCAGTTCGADLIPGEGHAPVCDPSGGPGGCALLTIDHVAYLYLPAGSIDISDLTLGPGGDLGPFEPELLR